MDLGVLCKPDSPPHDYDPARQPRFLELSTNEERSGSMPTKLFIVILEGLRRLRYNAAGMLRYLPITSPETPCAVVH